MPTANERILNNILRRVIYTNKSIAHIQNILAKELLAYDIEFRAKLLTALEGLSKKDLEAFSLGQNRTTSAFKKLNDTLANMKQDSQEIFESVVKIESKPLLVSELNFASNNLAKSVPVALDVQGVAISQLEATLFASPLKDGLNLKKYTQGWSESKFANVDRVVRAGIFNGESYDKIGRTLFGTKSKDYKDGVLSKGQKGSYNTARNIAGMAVKDYSSKARLAVYQANDDIIAELKWVSTLDARTSTECRNLDGQVFPNDGKHPNPGEVHFGICRSELVPIIASYEKLKKQGYNIPKGERASLDGKVPEDLNYYDWLIGTASEKTQIDAIGVRRVKLLQEGKITEQELKQSLRKGWTIDEMDKRFDLE